MRKRRSKRAVFYACTGINDQGKLVSQSIAAASEEEAAALFSKEQACLPQEILGPFYKKRQIINKKEIKFANETIKAIYKGWEVNAFLLKEPSNHAFLIFIKNIGSAYKPKGIIVVPIEELKNEQKGNE